MRGLDRQHKVITHHLQPITDKFVDQTGKREMPSGEGELFVTLSDPTASLPGRRRLDAKHGEMVLRADCYAAREENRRLLLQQLHTLITEAQAFAPSLQASPLQRLLASVNK